MRSGRLPGKVLMDVCGRPLVWHVAQRVRAARTPDKIVVATTTNAIDDPLCRFLEGENIEVFRGSEEDVLDRYYRAAMACAADIIVRVTPDDPFKDPDVIDHAVQLLLDANPPVEYVANCSYDGSIPATYPEGIDIEVMTVGCLEKLWSRARRPSEREHVTPYLFSHPDEFRVLGFQHAVNLSHLRWTIDYESDLAFAREVYNRLYPTSPAFRMADVLVLLEREPELGKINVGTERHEGYKKSVSAERPTSV